MSNKVNQNCLFFIDPDFHFSIFLELEILVASPNCLSGVSDSRKTNALHKEWSFTLRISLVTVTKSAVSCGFGDIY